MAGGSHKKRTKANAFFIKAYTALIALCNGLFLFTELYTHGAQFGGMLDWFRVLFVCGSSAFTYWMVMDSLQHYVWSEAIKGYSFDYACIVSFVQVTTTLISSKFFWLFLVVPGYIVYVLGRRLLDWVFTPTEQERYEAQNSAAMDKRAAKRERRMRRGR